MDDAFQKRARSLEEAFFAQESQRLIQKLREAPGSDNAPAKAGITDPRLVASLHALHLDGNTFAALSLIPALEIAWVDDRMQTFEALSLLELLEEWGIEEGSPAYTAFEGWLRKKPDEHCFTEWEAFTRALCQKLQADQREELRDYVLERANQLAGASGGFLGVGSVSAGEKALLARIEAAFA